MAVNRMHVSSALDELGRYQFYDWLSGYRGKLPKPSYCDSDSYGPSLQFGFDIYDVRARYESLVNSTWKLNRGNFASLNNLFLQNARQVFEDYGFEGTLLATGLALRDSKKPWTFRLTGCNFKPYDNFILAKLMGKEIFEDEIWNRVITSSITTL